MPAVTVENVLGLERVERPAAESLERPIVSITTAPSEFEGEGFPVRRGFAGIPQEQLEGVSCTGMCPGQMDRGFIAGNGPDPCRYRGCDRVQAAGVGNGRTLRSRGHSSVGWRC